MQFDCPHCGATYKVKDIGRLENAGGRVLCYRCDKEFLVSEAVVEDDQDAAEQVDTAGDDQDSTDESPATINVENVVTGAQPEYDLQPIGGNRRLFVLTSYPDQSETLVEHFKDLLPKHRWKHSGILWSLGVLALVTALTLQILWSLQTRPPIHQFLQDACVMLGCEIPPLRDPAAISLMDRVFARDPEQSDILRLKLRLANNADFTQPFPIIELLLYDAAQAVVGKSRVTPRQYLATDEPGDMAPGVVNEVELVILDPGQAATGFAIEFL